MAKDVKQVKISGPAGLFVAVALILLTLAGAAASWGVLWRAWDWAF